MMEQNKRKKIVVLIEEKLKAIRRIEAGETIKVVARDYGVGEVTVGDWKRNCTKIEKWCINQASSSSGRKSMKTGDYERVNEALFMWFNQQRSKGMSLSGPILQQKALMISRHFLEIDQFTASSGWLDRWKKRYGVRQLTVCGEKLSADVSSVDKFKQDFKKQIENCGYTCDQIYNCDETGLNYKMLPSKTLASRQEKSAPGHKRTQNPTDGDWQVCTSKSFKRHLTQSPTPKVYYKSQKSAWMDATLFTTWFKEEFVPSVTKFLNRNRLPIKAILLMDNAPSHPGEGLHVGEIIVHFFPPNVTSIMQPMDQGILENIKKSYRRLYLEHLLEYTEKEDVISGMRKIILKNVIYWISQAWDSVCGTTIHKSWSQIIDFKGYNDSEDDTSLNELALKNRGETSCSNFDSKTEEEKSLLELMQNLKGCDNVTKQDVVDWVTADDLEEEMSIEEITNTFQETEKSDDSDDDEAVDDQPPTKISHQEGFASWKKALKYIEQQPEATPANLLFLNRWKNIAAKKRRCNMKQERIDTYFTVL
ncbi:jerky protein homolog-like [Euwallacea similis]|uniref:jerky protein homolog-like n=1 Tax=Euwallacea similis TaxID=1736056 RepID=UPI00344D3970